MYDDILSRYELAQSLILGVQSAKVVKNDAVFAHWFEDSQSFWYIKETQEGKQFRIVDANTACNAFAFDHKELAGVLEKITNQVCDYDNLPIKDVSITLSPLLIRFKIMNKYWEFEPSTKRCEEVAPFHQGLTSPDGKNTVYAHEHDVWVRDNSSGRERALTQDGDENYCYARACELNPSVMQALWSEDSKRLLVAISDFREVASRPIIHYVPADGATRPQLMQPKRAYAGDDNVELYRVVAIDVSTGDVQEADYQPLPFSGWRLGFFTDECLAWWSCDSRRAFFIDVERGAKSVSVVEFDTHTGDTRVLFKETSDTFITLRSNIIDVPSFLPLPESNELIWFSERTGWGHLYLYDLDTGELKHQITGVGSAGGDWRVRDILHYAAERREILVQTSARDKSYSPYYRDICLINIDTRELTPLVSGCFEHNVYRNYSLPVTIRKSFELDTVAHGVSPDGQYIVTTRSRVDKSPISLLIDREGREVLTIEKADVSGLPAGWQWPEPVKLKAADDYTDLYGVVFRPPGFTSSEHYPVLDFSCGLRYMSFVPQGSFVNGGPWFDFNYLYGAALASLGFIVVAINGRGTPDRNKAFQDHNFGDVSSTNDFNDRIAGLRQLAKKYPYMDLERVGITGTDNIANPVYGLLNHPEFYKVAVMHCYNDPRFTMAAFGEQFDGISTDNVNATKTQYAEDNVEALKGKLLLIQGMLDYATPASTFRLVDALQKANKDFDMICLPNVAQDMPSYGIRRNWDYLVTHLQGIDPPNEFNLVMSDENF